MFTVNSGTQIRTTKSMPSHVKALCAPPFRRPIARRDLAEISPSERPSGTIPQRPWIAEDRGEISEPRRSDSEPGIPWRTRKRASGDQNQTMPSGFRIGTPRRVVSLRLGRPLASHWPWVIRRPRPIVSARRRARRGAPEAKYLRFLEIGVVKGEIS
ncbi:hypothetical protein SEVIR_2G296600v4 [Setaria viridis]|uniref:Uncharacterized protein n=1 Tax=Setaria viridis TaxID=4556 RepID=A0A4U6VWH8_SETVI|nr:hypothetical protein SEVIR_2G296600v2 [Setaria viridis]